MFQIRHILPLIHFAPYTRLVREYNHTHFPDTVVDHWESPSHQPGCKKSQQHKYRLDTNERLLLQAECTGQLKCPVLWDIHCQGHPAVRQFQWQRLGIVGHIFWQQYICWSCLHCTPNLGTNRAHNHHQHSRHSIYWCGLFWSCWLQWSLHLVWTHNWRKSTTKHLYWNCKTNSNVYRVKVMDLHAISCQ